MKRYFLIYLMAAICFATMISPASASKDEQLNNAERSKQEQVDKLFVSLNEVVSEQKHLQQLATLNNKDTSVSTKINTILNKSTEKKAEIENQIESLGIKKLDPNNEADMDLLGEMYRDQSQHQDEIYATTSVPAPPDLAAVANIYSLYRYQGTYTYQNATYDYSYIRVVDDKGYNKLYTFKEYIPGPANSTQSVIKAVASTTFVYGFGLLLGNTPIGVATNWAMNGAIAGFSAYNTDLISSTSQPFYRIFASSTSSLTYFWIYYGSAWKFMGSDGTFSFTRTDFSAFNYQGQPKQLSSTQPTWSSSSGYSWYTYIQNFHNSNNKANYQQINPFGSFTINGATTYTPIFYSLPGYLI